MTSPLRSLLRLAALSLLLVAGGCFGGYYYDGDSYSNQLDTQQLLEGSSPLASAWSYTGNNYSGYQGPEGWHQEMTATADFECRSDQLESYAEELSALLKEDVFGSGFFLVPEECRVENLPASGSSTLLHRIELGWESEGARGSMLVEISTGPRTGAYGLSLKTDESTL
jgi:hypothetical protein